MRHLIHLAWIVIVVFGAAIVGHPHSIEAQDPGTGPYRKVTSWGREAAQTAAWNPDGSRLAVSEPSVIRIYDAQLQDIAQIMTGSLLSNDGIHHGNLAWSPDGMRIARVDRDQMLRVWDATTGETNIAIQTGLDDQWQVAWSPDGARLITRDINAVHLWDAATGRALATFYTTRGMNIAWEPGGSLLATGDQDGVRLWDMTTGAVLRTLDGEDVYSIAWNSDGTQLVGGGGHKYPLSIWDAATGRRMADYQKLPPQISVIGAIAWHPDGQTVALSGDRGCGLVHLLDVASGQVRVLSEEALGTVVGWNADGSRLAMLGCNGSVQLWDTMTNQLVAARWDHFLEATNMAWSPDGHKLAVVTTEADAVSGSTRDNRVLVWSMDTGEFVWTAQVQTVQSVIWDFGGNRLVTVGDSSYIQNYSPCSVQVWDAETGSALQTLWAIGDKGCPTIPSPDLKWLAVIHPLNDRDAVDILNAGEHWRKASIPLRGNIVSWSPDSTMIATNFPAQLWAITGRKICDLGDQGGTPVYWRPDGQQAADKLFQVWDIATCEPVVYDLAAKKPSGLTQFVPSPDWTRLAEATSSGTNVWKLDSTNFRADLIAYLPLESLSGPERFTFVASMAWSPDGTRLAVANRNGTITIWSE